MATRKFRWRRRANTTQALNQQVHSTDIEVFIWRLCLLLTMGCLIPLDIKEMQALLLANPLQQFLEHDIIAAFFEAKRLLLSRKVSLGGRENVCAQFYTKVWIRNGQFEVLQTPLTMSCRLCNAPTVLSFRQT